MQEKTRQIYKTSIQLNISERKVDLVGHPTVVRLGRASKN